MHDNVQNRATKESQKLEAIVKNLRKVAYDIQHVLDRIMLHEPHHSPTNKFLSKAYQLGHSIWPWGPTRGIQEEIQQIRNRMEDIHQSLLVPQPQSQSPGTELQHRLPETPEGAEIFGFEVSKQKLMSQLINNTGERNCSRVVVVGPPGSGKTALVNSVYRNKQVSRHFSCKLGARLSPHFHVNVVLRVLYQQTLQCCGKKTGTTGDVAANLKNNLQGKRYLVILDDVWSEKDWKEIMSNLPDESNGSRLVITTTIGDVASSVATSGGQTHEIEGLKEEELWKLFCSKAFPEEKSNCPSDLKELSKKVMDKCEGSPLAVSAVGRLLGKKKRLPADWENVEGSLRAEMESNLLFTDFNNSMTQSFDDLNGNLKSCLLYFSLFPEGEEDCIRWSRLIRLWVAEGFMMETEKAAEDVAEDYLNELIKRNLVVAKKDFDGCIKSCRVNNFLRYFLTIQSKKDDFAHVLDKPEVKAGDNPRRLSITDAFCKDGRKVKGKRCTSIMFGGVSLPHVKELCSQFKFLKVLDFQGAPLQNFPECVVDLGLLQYLGLRDSKDIVKVPSSIKKLRYLEFLDLKNTSVTCLPKEICLLHKLQHLLVYLDPKSTCDTFQGVQGMQMTGEIKSLSSLRKLTLLKAENHLGQLGNLRQLQKLGLIELRSSDGEALFDSLSNMKNLSVLDLRSVNERENLHLDYKLLHSNNLKRVYLKGPLEKLPRWLTSLKSLVRLHLKWSRLTSSSINKLQGLNALTELHLVDAFTGNKLEFKSTMFVKLKVLRIEDFAELTTLEVSKGSMCKLEKLTLCKCGQLKTIRMHHISELKELELFDMPVELTNRFRKSGLDRSRIKVHNPSSDAAELTGPEQNGILHDLVLPLVQSLKDFASRFR